MKPIPAVYEGGVFKPLKKVKLKERTEVEIIAKSKKKVVDNVAGKWDFVSSTKEFMEELKKGWTECINWCYCTSSKSCIGNK